MVNIDEEKASTVDEVWTLLDAGDVDDGVKYLIAAALESDEAFAEQLGDDATPVSRPKAQTAASVAPVHAYLNAITVSGFRGIGKTVELNLTPSPGLTVISGRNGSGKSSIAEALEIAVTGESYRWDKGQKLWQQGWRNLHKSAECRVGVKLVQQPADTSEPPTNVHLGVTWKGDDVAEPIRMAKPEGGEKRPANEVLGWARSVQMYRPILSYEELGSVFVEGPSALYDALNQILGLEEVTHAGKRIDEQLKSLGAKRKDSDRQRRELNNELKASDLAQAKEVLKETKSKSTVVDLAKVQELVNGSQSPQDQLIGQLRAVAELDVPEDFRISQVAANLRTAISESERAGTQALEALAARTELLDQAVRIVQQSDTNQCPVCEADLATDWTTQTTEAIAAGRSALTESKAAAATLQSAIQQAHSLLNELNAQALMIDESRLPEYSSYVRMVERAQQAPDNPSGLADHLVTSISNVRTALDALREPAADLAQSLNDRWAPLAMKTMVWLNEESAARELDATVARLKASKEWIAANADVLREQRMAPISEQARRIWADLRQQSDVDVTSIALAGTATRRRVELKGTVDGKQTPVLPVMSQGELQALALALFIPRATLPASRFGFLVLDDPIQAMDPAKVDGFLSVLQELAKTRQVIVFSHDDRLPSAIRRLAVDAQLFTVTRKPGSEVSIERADIPARRYLTSARSLIVDDALPDRVRNEAAPGLFRMALESAARQRFFSRAPQRGLSAAAAENEWANAHGTKALVLLAIDIDDDKWSSWLHQRDFRKNVMTIATAGTHSGAKLGISDLKDLGKMIDDLLGVSVAH